MARVSKEAVAGREALARKLFAEGKSEDQVQAAMMAYDCGGGRTGVRMTPARLDEIAAEVKGGKSAAQAARVEVRAADGQRLATVPPGETLAYGKVPPNEQHFTEADFAAPGSLRVSQCQPGKSYVSRGDAANIVGVYRGEEKGLYCFDMVDGCTFKLWAGERVERVGEHLV